MCQTQTWHKSSPVTFVFQSMTQVCHTDKSSYQEHKEIPLPTPVYRWQILNRFPHSLHSKTLRQYDVVCGELWSCNETDTYINLRQYYYIYIYIYTGCNRRNGPDFGRVFLKSNYTDITQNTYIQSWMVTEILAREKCGLLWCLRTVLRPW
jgi:hypothetical protein